jgi:hypothetical protein
VTGHHAASPLQRSHKSGVHRHAIAHHQDLVLEEPTSCWQIDFSLPPMHGAVTASPLVSITSRPPLPVYVSPHVLLLFPMLQVLVELPPTTVVSPSPVNAATPERNPRLTSATPPRSRSRKAGVRGASGARSSRAITNLDLDQGKTRYI